MTKITLSLFVATLFALGLSLAPAQAQPRTWVAGLGLDANPCTRASPCKTFAHAVSVTAAGGIINCVDAGDFGPVTINKSIMIDCTGVFASILADGPSGGIGVNVTAGATDIVTLRGLSIDGAGSGAFGIFSVNGTTLHIENTRIAGFRGGALFAHGIAYGASSGLGELHVSDSVISDNGTNSTNGGILIVPNGTGSANVSINRVQIKNNSVGVIADGRSSTGPAVNVNVRDSVVTGNSGNGITALSSAGHAGVTVLVERTTSSFNAGSGVHADGAAASGAGTARARIGNSVITQNVTGVSSANSGVIRTYKTNEINDNLTDGTPIANQDVLN